MNLDAIGRWQGDWETGIDYLALDIVRDSTTKNIYVCAVAPTSGGLVTDVARREWAGGTHGAGGPAGEAPPGGAPGAGGGGAGAAGELAGGGGGARGGRCGGARGAAGHVKKKK